MPVDHASTHDDRISELKEASHYKTNQGKLLKLKSVLGEDVRRHCSAMISDATKLFLFSWEKLSSSEDLPSTTRTSTRTSSLIGQLFSLLLLELGPSDAEVLEWLRNTLPDLESTQGRQLLLDGQLSSAQLCLGSWQAKF